MGVDSKPSFKVTDDVGAKLTAVTNGDRDNLRLLERVAARLSRVGLSFPGVEVRWENLLVEYQQPGVRGKLRSCGSPPKRAHRILDAGSGVLPPGRMCLLLGPPGAGRTTLLKALSGQLVAPSALAQRPPPAKGEGRGAGEDRSGVQRAGLSVFGQILFNGTDINSGAFETARSATYVAQTENHLPELTVEETLSFAAECQGGDMSNRLIALLREREAAAGLSDAAADLELDDLLALCGGPHAHLLSVELTTRMLSIDHVKDTVVGDENLKGISGGQKRRVTLGEMVVGKAPVMCLDEITNGLDAASALAIMRALRNVAKIANGTVVATLLQPSPEVYECFDDVLLVSHGRVAFHGPREELLPFFGRLGLRPQPGQTEADFAQEVAASPADQLKYRVEGFSAAGHKWISPKRLREAYDATPAGQKVAALLHAPAYSHPLQDLVLHKQRYGLPRLRMLSATLRREATLLARNSNFIVSGMVQTLFTAFLVSTTFVQLSRDNTNDANLFLSSIFYTLVSLFMGGFNFAPVFCARLPVFYKQRDHRFYTPAAYAVSSVVMRLPEVLVQAALFLVMTYFSVGFTPDAGRFFLMYVNLVAASVSSVATFQLIGALSRDAVVTQGLGAVGLMLNVLMSGFPIAGSSIPGWWIWLYWLNPMSWTLRSMAVTELTAPRWGSVGEDALSMRGFDTEWAWVWGGIAYVLATSVLQVLLQIAALTFIGPPHGNRKAPDHLDDDPAEDHPHRPHPHLHHLAALPALMPSDAPPLAHTSTSITSATSTTSEEGSSPRRDGGDAAARQPGSGQEPPAATDVVVDMRKGADAGHLDFIPVTFAFRDVSYYVPKPGGAQGEELQLLSRVSGVFRPGVLTSLMGASGAGKTTLMDVLAGRKTAGRAEGLQLVDGAPKRDSTFARMMGYVEQLDVHAPHATVREALLLSARLRVPAAQLPSASALRSFVDSMMAVVELEALADRRVGAGAESGGLSTEARKRLTIAVELVANPSIVFMDEPTSGLDARAAGLVMRAVRNTVLTGRTVVCTIHQPNREIMDFFDELLLLKPGGRTIFFGSLGRRQCALVDYLGSAAEGVPRYEAHMNPANWMLEVTSPAAEKELGVDFADVWAASEQARSAAQLVSQHTSAAEAALAAPQPAKGAGGRFCRAHCSRGAKCLPSPASDVEEGQAGDGGAVATVEALEGGGSPAPRFAQPLAVQLRLVLGRQLQAQARNVPYNGLRMGTTLMLGLILGSLYWGIGTEGDTELGILNIMGVMYTASFFLAMVNMLAVMPLCLSERSVYYREKASGMYAGAAFAFAQGTAELPFLFAQSVIYVTVVYGMVQFEFTFAKIMWFWLFNFLSLVTFTFLGICAANLAPNMPAASAGASLFVMLWNLFCGFLISRYDIGAWYIWAYWGNPLMYVIYGLTASQLGDLTDTPMALSGGGSTSVAQFVSDTYGYEYGFRGWAVLVLVAFCFAFRALSYLGLLRMNFQKR